MSRRSLSAFITMMVIGFCVYQYLGSQLVITAPAKKNLFTDKGQAAGVAYVIVPPQPVSLVVEPSDGVTPVLSQIREASTSVDLVMYELQDRDVEDALIEASGRGVAVRVLLNDGLYGKGSNANQPAYDYLQSHGVPVRWTPTYFALTHQKTLITDDSLALIMTFNLTPKYYPTSRDFAIGDPDASDVHAIEGAFDDDWNADAGTKDSATDGDDLIWSPGSKQSLLGMIDASHSSLLIYNEEMQDPDVIAALESAAERGVHVEVLLTDSTQWHAAFSGLVQSGVAVRTYDPKASLYIHAKMILSDGSQAFVGSENFSSASMNDNRELGMLLSTPAILAELQTIYAKDWEDASLYTGS